MIFWFVASLLAVGAALVILIPAQRARRADFAAEDSLSADMAVYKDQIDELDRDLARGLIEPETAGEARIEIARRLLGVDELLKSRSSANKGMSRYATALIQGAALLFIPVASIVLYLFLGVPGAEDQPLQARLNVPSQDQSLDVLIARVEQHLADNPNDGQGWDILAPVYMRIADPARAATAYAKAASLLGSTYQREIGYGEALLAIDQGIVNDEARAAFERANRLDPEAVKPRFYLAEALTQEGRVEEARTAWRRLLEDAQEGAGWVEVARTRLAELQGGELATDAPGPTAADVSAASNMTEADRAAMIEGMVAGLSERLTTEGGGLQEWTRLIRAYVVLKRPEDAQAALEKAKNSFKDESTAIAQLEALGRELGLSVSQ
ncbi:MAG: c-type cytochrome biogenesis protein CcmI [Rhodobacteraceae bacterium]|nr:c-type cytochrome biogenesis protein CcmI [Paracoccaceae bacterium]